MSVQPVANHLPAPSLPATEELTAKDKASTHNAGASKLQGSVGFPCLMLPRSAVPAFATPSTRQQQHEQIMRA